MNEDVLKGKWKELTGQVKEHWGRLTDDDINEIDGRSERLEGKLQERYGMAKEEAKQAVRRFERDL